ncbi:hypothetical protein BDZ94DRAFT_1257645 [Collybia nuda]|uniref:MARVEL domain-containing protein n=1 Tax=Collybia nuda TaxID=64659 RepID=A0A9P5Y5V0_9AGAR|nr:hypothetical protein BDZ94DRAFT_1257645 [Collybia nuda]
MPLIDRMSDLVARIVPSKNPKPSASMSGGIGHGMVPFEDDMIVSKPTIVFHTSQIFFNFLAMACFASVGSFQAKWNVGPSGLTGFAIFISVAGICLSLFMLMVPVVYEKYDKFVRLARALKEVRVGFILTGTGVTASLLIAFIVTISAWTQPGCKNPENDPHAGDKDKGDDFKKGLEGWCSTKKAGAIFFWLAFGEEGDEDDEDASYHHIPPVNQPAPAAPSTTRYDNSNVSNSPFADSNRYNAPAQQPMASRPSMDAYGAFSDPAPSGFAAPGGFSSSTTAYTATPPGGYATPPSGFGSSPSRTPVLPEIDAGPRVSRTMQYADPYAAVRASIAGQQGSPTGGVPPSYESYQGYR